MTTPGRPEGPRRPPRPTPTGSKATPPAAKATPPAAKATPTPKPQPDPKAAKAAKASRAAQASTPTQATPRVQVKVPKVAAPAGSPKVPTESKEPKARAARQPRPHVEDLVDAPPTTKSPFRQRFGNPYDTQGPKIRLGVLWALAVVAVLVPHALRPWGLAVLYGVVAGVAAAQVVDARRADRGSLDRTVAAFAGSALPVVATLGAQALGIGFLALVAVAVLATLVAPEQERAPVARAGRIVEAAGICGAAGASLVLLAEYEFGAVIMLLVFVMVYDASDFVVGSGASNGIEGPLAGALFIAATAAIFAVVGAPPFRGADIWSFAVLAMIACPVGQILASAMLPEANTHAPALRRLDSLLVVAPAWAGLVGLYLTYGIQ